MSDFFDEDTRKYMSIFQPEAMFEYSQVMAGGRFAYYTSADTAVKILTNGELWLRNATAMNDFMEISYGLSLVDVAFRKGQSAGDVFRAAVDSIFPNALVRVGQVFQSWRNIWEKETYIACVSAHNTSEDQYGRLSMWRAYGNIALVINNTPMMQLTDELGVYSIPVSYMSNLNFQERLHHIAQRMKDQREFLVNLGEDHFVGFIQHFLMNTALGTKHPGFSEEREWRIFFQPSDKKSDLIDERIVVLNGVAQKIFVLPLKHDPVNGLHHADIPTLVERIIIGPTEYSYVASEAFKNILTKLGVKSANEKIAISDIPLRVRD
jgi:hypothetical protein